MEEEVLPVMTIAGARKNLDVSPTRMKQLLEEGKVKTILTEDGHRLVLSASVHARNASPTVRALRAKLKKTPA